MTTLKALPMLGVLALVCTSCVPRPPPPSPAPPGCTKESNKELCGDGVDNDCNGLVEEGCPCGPNARCNGALACRDGCYLNQTCGGGGTPGVCGSPPGTFGGACTQGACNSPLVCDASSKCVECGRDGAPCCQGGQCASPLVCGAGGVANVCASCAPGYAVAFECSGPSYVSTKLNVSGTGCGLAQARQNAISKAPPGCTIDPGSVPSACVNPCVGKACGTFSDSCGTATWCGPTLTKSFCCVTPEAMNTVSGSGCSYAEARADALRHIFGSCPLAEGACPTSICGGGIAPQKYEFCCRDTKTTYVGLGCDVASARTAVESYVQCAQWSDGRCSL